MTASVTPQPSATSARRLSSRRMWADTSGGVTSRPSSAKRTRPPSPGRNRYRRRSSSLTYSMPIPMKRLTDRMVSSGRSVASARARRPTITSPPGRNATAEGSRRSPVSGSGRTRGPSSSRTATRLLVVPRSMPMIRPTQSFSHDVFDVAEQRPQVGDLREPPPQLFERATGVPVPVSVLSDERFAQAAETRRERGAQVPHLPAQRLLLRALRSAQLGQLLLGLEDLGCQRRRHLGVALGESRPVPVEPVP